MQQQTNDVRFFCRQIYFAYMVFVLLQIPQLSYAAASQVPINLFELDIEELTTISVASKKEETIEQAPSVVTVVTADEIKRYGARNLRDILDRQTSLQIIGSNLFSHNRAVIRGAAFTHQDNTVLLTLNGRPIRDAVGISNRSDIYSLFPIDSIKRIEIIRGPGSVLYGTTAQTGVINIITKDAPDQLDGSVSVGYGSFDQKQTQISGGTTWKDVKIFTSINLLETAGDDFNNITGEVGSGTYKTGKSGGQGILNLAYKDFKLNVMLGDMNYDSARSTFTLPSSEQQFERHYVDLGHDYQFNQNWKLTTNLQYHHLAVIGKTSLTGNGNAQSEDYLAEFTLFGKINQQWGMLVGGTYNLREGSLLSGLSWSSSISSVYSQLDYSPLDWLKLVGGLQYNKPAETTGDLSSRFSAIVDINQDWGLKFLYGEAFRSPTPIERFISAAPFLVGNASLEPEKIVTFDAQLFYQTKDLSFAATYFHSKQDGLVTRGGSPTTFVNSGQVTYDGIELEGKWTLNNKWRFSGNLSYQTNEDQAGAHDVAISSNWMAKGGISYDSNRGYRFSIFNSFFGEPTSISDISTSVSEVNPEAESYNLLTANMEMNLGDTFKNNALSNINLSIYADNLLDEGIFYPSINRQAVNTIPHHYGRGFYGTISVDF